MKILNYLQMLISKFLKKLFKIKIRRTDQVDELDIDNQLLDKINKFAPIKHILKNKLK